MKKINTRFGEVEYDPEKLLNFPEGMVGLPNLRDFIVMPNKKGNLLFWIQSVDDGDIAFVLTDPNNFFLDYSIAPDDSVRQILELDQEAEYFVLSVVTVPADQNITVNLSAPIIYAPTTNKAMQVILDDPKYKTKTPLPSQ